MKKIGIISDTHGCFDQTLRDFLSEVDEIWHAGDIGSLELADRIAAFRCEEVQVLMTHIGGYPRHYDPRALRRIQQLRPKLFIAGHSHILKVLYDGVYDLLYVNPGAAGEFGFHRVRTAVRLSIDGDRMFDMEVGEWPRG